MLGGMTTRTRSRCLLSALALALGLVAAPGVTACKSASDKPEMKTFTPDPAHATKRDVPPDGVLRMVKLQLVTSLPDFEQRCADVDRLAAFVEAAVRVVADHDAATPGELGATVNLWLAFRPGNQARAWLTGEPAISPAVELALAPRIEQAAAPPTTTGPIVLVLPLARREGVRSDGFPRAPEAWTLAAETDLAEDAAMRAWDRR